MPVKRDEATIHALEVLYGDEEYNTNRELRAFVTGGVQLTVLHRLFKFSTMDYWEALELNREDIGIKVAREYGTPSVTLTSFPRWKTWCLKQHYANQKPLNELQILLVETELARET